MGATMERDADVVVVGAGIVGCASAYYLQDAAFRFSRFAEGAIGRPRNVL